MTNEDKQRIEKEAVDYSTRIKPLSIRMHHEHGYIAGATAEHELLTPQLEYANSTIKKFSAELERSEKLLQEYREVIRELLPIAEQMAKMPMQQYHFIKEFTRTEVEAAIQKAKSLLHQPNRAI